MVWPQLIACLATFQVPAFVKWEVFLCIAEFATASDWHPDCSQCGVKSHLNGAQIYPD